MDVVVVVVVELEVEVVVDEGLVPTAVTTKDPFIWEGWISQRKK